MGCMEGKIKLSIVAMQGADIDSVVDIHLLAFPGFFLTELGRGFLKTYYRSLMANTRGIALVCKDDRDIVLGFATAVVDPSSFYSELLRNKWLSFGSKAAPAVLRKPRIAFRLARAFTKSSEAISDERTAELTSLGVVPTAKNKGIGRRLTGGIIEAAQRMGCKEIVAYTDAINNDKANSFYQALGFGLSRTFATHESRKMNEYRKQILKNQAVV